MININYNEIMRAEVNVDVYGGANCDEHSRHFELHVDGDRDTSITNEDIILNLEQLAPGTKISVKEPICPTCGIPQTPIYEKTTEGYSCVIGYEYLCENCGFDWKNWIEECYS